MTYEEGLHKGLTMAAELVQKQSAKAFEVFADENAMLLRDVAVDLRAEARKHEPKT